MDIKLTFPRCAVCGGQKGYLHAETQSLRCKAGHDENVGRSEPANQQTEPERMVS
jgi:hypothetical protein